MRPQVAQVRWEDHDRGMRNLAITWQMRVAAALVLAALLRMSDGSELWARTIPDLLTTGAVTLAIVMIVLHRRASRGV
jgi:hypothetical protein